MTLSLGYADYMDAVSRFLGYGPSYLLLDAARLAEVDGIVQSGLRKFYYPPSPPAPNGGYEWRFLKPTVTMEFSAADTEMPSTFGFIMGDIVISTSGFISRVDLVSEAVIRSRRSVSAMTGTPRLAALRPKANDGTTEQRYELLLWPTPDTTHSLTFQQQMVPNKLSAAAPYPLGPVMHSETILEACLAVAETRTDDEKGLHNAEFVERLTASITFDQRSLGPRIYGYNGNGSREALRRHEYGFDLTLDWTGTDTVTTTTDIEEMLGAVWGGRDGVRRTDALTQLKVSATSPATMTVSVAAGMGMLTSKVFKLDNATILALTAPVSNPRVDLIQASWDADGAEQVTVKQGTEAASPVTPSADADCIALASVAMTVGQTSIVTGNITDARSFL